MKRRRTLLAGGLVALLGIVTLWIFKDEEVLASRRPVAYVVCGDDRFQDNRVYRVDLLAGELKGVSDPIARLGNPDHLAFDPVHSRLYIASMSGRSGPNYWPVTVVRVGNGEFEVMNRFTTRSADNSPGGANAGKGRNGPYEAYEIVVSPNGNELYVRHGGLVDSDFLTAVWDSETGQILRLLRMPIQSHYSWSPDGNYVATIWPSARRERREGENIFIEKLPGGVGIVNTHTGETEKINYLQENKGMHPPWSRIDEPLIDFSPLEWGTVGVYDRDTGEIMSEFDIQESTGLVLQSSPIGDRSAVLDGGRLFAVSLRQDQSLRLWDSNEADSDYPSYIVLIDVIDQREITRTLVGQRCSNAVVAYE